MDAAFGMEYLHDLLEVYISIRIFTNILAYLNYLKRQHTLLSGGVRGTLPWMAPELLSGKSCMVSEKELLTGDEPYGDMHCASIIVNTISGKDMNFVQANNFLNMMSSLVGGSGTTHSVQQSQHGVILNGMEGVNGKFWSAYP
ncbi:hypothetical protein CTI12_AA596860 [Artemisia annua]|uniref:Uncharacterized protein n=1 Tax=Artemisia annua TaxID=35608 RepID=A0A2U1KIH7_ARTAN|nr:hypothetical protein CTI12_AA596860 [Artemisia annua]